MAFQKIIGFANGDPRNATGSFGGKPLRTEAAFHLERLNGAYKQRFKKDIPILEGMRSIATQQHYWNLYQAGRGNLAAWPGTSNHGFGVAGDLGSPLDNRYSAEHTWLAANAPLYGWWWAGRTFSQVEPWHFEFDGRNGNDTIPSGAIVNPDELTEAQIAEVTNLFLKRQDDLAQKIAFAAPVRAMTNTNTGKIHLISTSTGNEVHIPSTAYYQLQQAYGIFSGNSQNAPQHVIAYTRELYDALGTYNTEQGKLDAIVTKLADEAKG